MLHLTFPNTHQAERSWICQVLMGEFLGVEYRYSFANLPDIRITSGGKTLHLPDVFFPGRALDGNRGEWDIAEDGLDARLSSTRIPVLFGRGDFSIEDSSGRLSLDVFGSAFFMLARCEELTCRERDRHDRFPVTSSLAARLHFIHRPLVDEYVEILWAVMKRLWPELTRKHYLSRNLISCDVDLPFDPACASAIRMTRRLLGNIVRRRPVGTLVSTLANYTAVKHGDKLRDPYWYALFWMMDVNERAGNQVTFNFIPEATDRAMDNAPSLDHPRLRDLLRRIHDRGHLIGLHPGYNTYRHPASFTSSVSMLKRVMDEEGIEQDTLGGRQHYLRWDPRVTARLWESNKMSYDSTLSYATTAGFRCGTCREYTMFDPAERRPMRLRQRPLIVMENAVIDDCNMGLGHGDAALATMQNLKNLCRYFRGDFTLLWHNSSFESAAHQEMYCEMIK
jgi:hypothetical protein